MIRLFYLNRAWEPKIKTMLENKDGRKQKMLIDSPDLVIPQDSISFVD